jgi:hypothetical protein
VSPDSRPPVLVAIRNPHRAEDQIRFCSAIERVLSWQEVQKYVDNVFGLPQVNGREVRRHVIGLDNRDADIAQVHASPQGK